jgi:hypothetical protein
VAVVAVACATRKGLLAVDAHVTSAHVWNEVANTLRTNVSPIGMRLNVALLKT